MQPHARRETAMLQRIWTGIVGGVAGVAIGMAVAIVLGRSCADTRANPDGVRDWRRDRSCPWRCAGQAEKAAGRRPSINMTDIKNPRLLYAKGALFVLGGLLASGLILAEHPNVKIALLLGIAIWCFARAYYFAFYVIEHYVDPSYKFAGLGSFVRYLLRNRRRDG